MPLNVSLSDLTCFPMAAVVCVSPGWINTRLMQSVWLFGSWYFPWGETDRRQEVEGVLSARTLPFIGVCTHTHTSLTYTLLLICSTGLHRSMESSRGEYLTLAQAGTEWNNRGRHSLSPRITIKIWQKKKVLESRFSHTLAVVLLMSSVSTFCAGKGKQMGENICLKTGPGTDIL